MSFSLAIRHFIAYRHTEGKEKTFMMIAEKLFLVKWQVIHVGTMISIIN
jgi:hypothetical protein